MKPIKLEFDSNDRAGIVYGDEAQLNECFGGAMCRNLKFKVIRIETEILSGTYNQYWCNVKKCPVVELDACPDHKWIKLVVPIGEQNIGNPATFKAFEAV